MLRRGDGRAAARTDNRVLPSWDAALLGYRFVKIINLTVEVETSVHASGVRKTVAALITEWSTSQSRIGMLGSML